MLPISGFVPGAERPLPSVPDVKGPPENERPENADRSRPIKPVKDEYIPEENQEPIGRYRPGRDENGDPKIYFDDPRQDKAPKAPDGEDSGGRADSCTGSTDRVDREIEKLKKRQKELEQKIGSETDAKKIEKLERELEQVESELREKDNDTYRRQHAVFS